MSLLLERVRSALAPQLQVERELGGGAMGVVFLGRDVSLDRPVAIKVLRPELATAAASDRFLAEGRILAQLHHPNLMTVHQAGEAAGLLYYVMEYLTGETLFDRMVRERLTRAEALKLGRDLLDGLEAAHRVGVVHRDVKPENVMLQNGRAVLFDFGIAKSSQSPPHRKGSLIGTPAYMSPEQREGNDVTLRSDLYGAAVVLYEAFSGRTFRPGASWDGVPRAIARVLQRALAEDPADRWPDARSFRRALWRTRTTPYLVRTGLLTLLGLLAGGAVGIFAGRAPADPLPPADLAILPFTVTGNLDSSVGVGLAHLATLNLQSVPGFSVAPATVARAGDTAGGGNRALRARRSARGTLAPENGALVLRMEVVDSSGARLPVTVVRGSTGDLAAFGYAAGLALLRAVAPGNVTSYTGLGGLSDRGVQAIRAFLQGEEAFQRDAWAVADAAYRRAVALDSSFALARWRLANVIRWRRMPQEVDLPALYRDHASELGELDRRLLEAELAPPGPARFASYQRALQGYPLDGYAALLYGAELMHRGALAGVPLDSAVTVLQRAAQLDGFSARTQSHLSWALIRLGRREEARAALDRLSGTAARAPDADFDIPVFLELAWVERFAPDRAPSVRAALSSQPAAVRAALSQAIRWSASFDVPRSQVELATLLRAGTQPGSRARAEMDQARGLGLVGLGRVREGLSSIAVAANGFGSQEALLQAAEWPVIAQVAGLTAPVPDESLHALERLADKPGTRARAAWARALAALARNDSAAWRAWRERIPVGSPTRLVQLLDAMAMARAGQPAAALAHTPALTDTLSEPDPFYRAILRLSRGDWLHQLGDTTADREWRFYQHMDLTGWPTGVAQPGEVDWALAGVFGLRRAAAAIARGRSGAACALLRDVAARWTEADSVIQVRFGATASGVRCS